MEEGLFISPSLGGPTSIDLAEGALGVFIGDHVISLAALTTNNEYDPPNNGSATGGLAAIGAGPFTTNAENPTDLEGEALTNGNAVAPVEHGLPPSFEYSQADGIWEKSAGVVGVGLGGVAYELQTYTTVDVLAQHSY